MSEMICPFCGESVYTFTFMGSVEYSCETIGITRSYDMEYTQSDRCKENSKKKEEENV